MMLDAKAAQGREGNTGRGILQKLPRPIDSDLLAELSDWRLNGARMTATRGYATAPGPAGRPLKFCIVGFGGLFVNLAVYSALVTYPEFRPEAAAASAFVTAVAH